MLRHPLFRDQFIVLSLVALLHVTAVAYSLYWLFPWFDVLTHFLGGVWVAFSGMWLFGFSNIRVLQLSLPTKGRLLVVALLSTLSVGAGWEVWEYLLHSNDPSTLFDTKIDILMDTAGALCAWLYVRVKYIYD